MNESPSIHLDGNQVPYRPGETLLEVATRVGQDIPTLCHDPRLEPMGSCRTCLVEIEGWPRLAPSCATSAAPGMQVTTVNPRIQRHRRLLFSLYLADHPTEHEACEDGAPCELHHLACQHNADPSWPHMEPLRADRPGDRNPYVEFRADRCILCARCTRYCDEVEGVSAITLTGRGSDTTISTSDQISLMDSSCELCGGCIAVCPTGAMAEKMPLEAGAPPERELQKVRTTCNYCGVGCQLDLNVDPSADEGRGRIVKVTSPPPGTITGDGNLCVKGRFAYDFVHHPDRLTTPLIRQSDGTLGEASWEEAIARAAAGLTEVRKRHGSDALGFISSSRCTGEENYLIQKLARAVFGTNNIHSCAAT